MPFRPGPAMTAGSARQVGSGLWRHADFRKLWIGQTVSQFGAQASQVMLPLVAVVALHADAGELGALRAVQQAPVLLFSLVVGVWVDRRRSSSVMVWADLGRAVLLAVIPAIFLLGLLDVPVLLTVAFGIGTLTVCFDLGYQSSLVQLVPREHLPKGNSALESSRSAAQIAGPALGGALVSLLSAPIATGASALFYALSALAIGRIGRRKQDVDHAERSSRVWRQMHDGVRLVVTDRSLRAIGLCSAIFQLSFAALMTVYLLFLVRTLQLSGALVGLVLAALGPGAVVGSVLSAVLPPRLGYGVVLVSSAALADATMLGIPALRGPTTTVVLLLVAINFVFGVCGQLVDVTVTTVRQAITPASMQGRVVATLNVVGMGLTPLGSLLGGVLAQQWGYRTSLLVTALALSLSPVIMVLSPLARLGRTLPATRGS
jgi:predicted MFS family arabinose efflux permease